jgi:hypothetical protein
MSKTPRKSKLELHREYNLLHAEEIRLSNAIHDMKNREKRRASQRLRRQIRKKEEANNVRQKRSDSLKSWKGFIPYKTTCEICGKIIYYKALKKINSIHFDHRHEGKEPIKEEPSQWLKNHVRNKTNESLWIESDFGMLCHLCNYRLPTMGRKDWVIKMNKYVSRIGT